MVYLIEKIIKKFKPKIVYTPPNDLNRDHQRVFESTLVASRPSSSSVKKLLCYELPGFTREPFRPNTYVDITKEISVKIKSFKIYKNEVMKFPHPRSIQAIENLAIHRGVEASLRKAEAFQLIRSVLA